VGEPVGVVGPIGVVHVALGGLEVAVAGPALDADDVDAGGGEVRTQKVWRRPWKVSAGNVSSLSIAASRAAVSRERVVQGSRC
jgi:hypothetical protein